MKYFILTIFSLGYLYAFSQNSDKETVTYKLTRENTDIRFITEKINIWDNQISGSRFTMSGGAGTCLYINGFILNAFYDFQYLDNLAAVGDKSFGESIYAPTKSRFGDASIGYNYQHKTRAKVGIRLGSKSDNRRTSYETKIDAEIIRFFGLQGGMRKGFSHLTIPKSVTVTSTGKTPTDVQTEGKITTFMSYNWMYFGTSYGRIEDVKAMFTTFGERGSNYFKRFYFNVLFATKAQLENIYMEELVNTGTSTITGYREYNLDKVNFSNTGFQIGFENTTFKKKVSVNYGLEGGIYPGIANSREDNMYLVLRWSITFNQYFGGKDYVYKPVNNDKED